MIFEKDNYLPVEQIKGKIHVKIADDNEILDIILQLAHVYDWFDESIYVNVKGIVKNDTLTFSFPNGLERGLYILICIKDSNGNILIGKDNDSEHCVAAFSILAENEKNGLDTYKKVYDRREITYNKQKGRVGDQNSIPFNVFIFCKNIKVGTIAQYGDVQIYPYEYLSLASEVNYINSFFKNNTDIELIVKEEPFKSSVPSAVFMITNIMALSYEEAEQYALWNADVLNNIFTILLRSHGAFFATVVLNTKENVSKINMLDTRYKGNLFLFAEQGFNIRHYYNYLCSNDTYLKVYIKLLNEAMKEENRMLQYYRFWNILEGIASKKNYKCQPMKKWDGSVVKTKGSVVLIDDKGLDIVFELVRSILSTGKDNEFISNLESLKSAKEFLSVCYQRRNCCAHQGEC